MNIDTLAEDISELLVYLYDANIQSSMGGLGGCKHFELQTFPAKYQRYIQNYVNHCAPDKYFEGHSRDSSQCIIDYLFDNHYLAPVVRSL